MQKKKVSERGQAGFLVLVIFGVGVGGGSGSGLEIFLVGGGARRSSHLCNNNHLNYQNKLFISFPYKRGLCGISR